MLTTVYENKLAGNWIEASYIYPIHTKYGINLTSLVKAWIIKTFIIPQWLK